MTPEDERAHIASAELQIARALADLELRTDARVVGLEIRHIEVTRLEDQRPRYARAVNVSLAPRLEPFAAHENSA